MKIQGFNVLCRVLIAALIMAAMYAPAAAADEWPAPSGGWWKNLKSGDTATFEMTLGNHTMRMVIKILNVHGTEITFSTQTSIGGDTLPEQTQTVDATKDEAGGSVPESAVVLAGSERTFEAGGRTFNCREYEIIIKDISMKTCHSRQLPVIFNGGNVSMTSKTGESVMTITLKDYTGKMLGE